MPKAEKESKPRKAAAPKKTAKAKKDPDEPKKPLSSFMLFSKEHRPKIKEENPDMSFGEIGKEVGARWRALSDAEKKVFQDRVDKEKEKYTAAMEEYKKKEKKADNDEGEEEEAEE